MRRGGMTCNTSWLFDEECPFSYSTHEATDKRGPFVTVDVGTGDGYHYMSFRTVAVLDRLIDTLIEARVWLRAHDDDTPAQSKRAAA